MNEKPSLMSLRVRFARSPMRIIWRFDMKYWAQQCLALRCWILLGAYALLCFILYWLIQPAVGGIFTFFFIAFATTGIIYYLEDRLIYYPDVPKHSRVYIPAPSIFNLPYQSIYTKSSDGIMLHMFFIPQPEPKMKDAHTLLYFHGNAGNMGHRLLNAVGLYRNLHCNILMLDYRGFGLSQGTPSEEGLYKDAQAAIDYLVSRNDISSKKIILFGRSLGGAVAIDLASRPDIAERIYCLIVENTFTSIPDMASVLLGTRLFQYLPLFCYKNKFMSLHKVRALTVPSLFISGQADLLVPPQMMKDLHECCESWYKALFNAHSGTHNETWKLPGYYEQIIKFLANVRENTPSQPQSVEARF